MRAEPPDLMAALKASLEAARAKRPGIMTCTCTHPTDSHSTIGCETRDCPCEATP